MNGVRLLLIIHNGSVTMLIVCVCVIIVTCDQFEFDAT